MPMQEVEVIIHVGDRKRELIAPSEVSVRALLRKAGELLDINFEELVQQGLAQPMIILSKEDLDITLRAAGIRDRSVLIISRPVDQQTKSIREKPERGTSRSNVSPMRKK